MACAPPPLTGVGRATDMPVGAGSSRPAVITPAVSPIAPGYADRLKRVGRDAFVVSGHAGGRYTGTVYVTADAVELVEQGKDVPAGTEVVMATTTRLTHAAGPTFFMLKQASGWRFGVVENPEAKPEDVALCTRCHAEAPHDAFFALP